MATLEIAESTEGGEGDREMCAEGGEGGTADGVWGWVQALVCCQIERCFVCRGRLESGVSVQMSGPGRVSRTAVMYVCLY